MKSDAADGFDPSVIEGLAAIMSKEDMRSLLIEMVDDAESRLHRIRTTAVTPDGLRQIERDAHDLKSISGNFGLNGLSQCAGVVERAARNGCVESTRASVPDLVATGERSLLTVAKRHAISLREHQ